MATQTRMLLAALLLGAHFPENVTAQPDEPLVMTVGTAHTSPTKTTWAYLSWQETVDGAIGDTPLAIFQKEGFPDYEAPYERVSIVGWITDPLTIKSMLARAPELNDDLALLESRIDEIFGEMIQDIEGIPGIASLPLESKVSALLTGTRDDPELRETVRWLGRVHPAFNLCLGRAFATPIPADRPATFEVRSWDASADASVAVLGRVTVDPADTLARKLPAPGTPMALTETSGQGHLSVRMLWATPDELRRRAPMHFGFNVYRVDAELAEALGFHITPPDPLELATLAEDPSETAVRRVNRSPVLADRLLTESEAKEIALKENPQEAIFFFGDDNDRYNYGEPFEDGDTYYYFLTARDILGRDGRVSDGARVMVCSRIPPHPPQRVWVENEYTYLAAGDTGSQLLAVQWELSRDERADRYYVYRFRSVQEMQEATRADYRTEEFLIAGPIEPNGDGILRYVDDGSGAGTLNSIEHPSPPDDYGIPWLYTVRAEADAACGGNLSGHSPPVWGVLRQREGPEGADASLLPLSRVITLDPPLMIHHVDEGIEADYALMFRAIARRLHPGIQWAEFHVQAPPRAPYEDRFLGRLHFGPGDGTVSTRFFHRIVDGQFPVITAIVGGSGMAPVKASVSLQELKGDGDYGLDGKVGHLAFTADVETGYDLAGAAPDLHTSVDPETGEINCLPLVVDLTAEQRAAEWRIYRRLGQGELTLVHQQMREPGSGGILEWEDCTLPARGGVACYFVQPLDDEGNPGPISRAGCVEFEPTHPLPQPMLYPVQALEPEEGATARISWFSSPEGVERFEVLIAPSTGTLPADIGSDLTARSHEEGDAGMTLPGYPDLRFFAYDTGRVGATLHGDGPEFSVDAQLPGGVQYTIVVRAAGAGPFTGRAAEERDSFDDIPPIAERQRGAVSNSEIFAWTPPEEELRVLVPWPARDLPPVAAENSVFRAELISLQTGVGVKIGEFVFVTDDGQPIPMPPSYPYPLRAGFDPNEAVFTPRGEQADSEDVAAGKTLLPLVLYRYQMPNSIFPTVSGDLVQVSPLLREIAYKDVVRDRIPPEDQKRLEVQPGFPPPGHTTYNILQDPFVAVKVKENPFYAATHELFIVDNQPVAFGAKYRYLLVRFTQDGEIDRVIPVPPLDLGAAMGGGE